MKQKRIASSLFILLGIILGMIPPVFYHSRRFLYGIAGLAALILERSPVTIFCQPLPMISRPSHMERSPEAGRVSTKMPINIKRPLPIRMEPINTSG